MKSKDHKTFHLLSNRKRAKQTVTDIILSLFIIILVSIYYLLSILEQMIVPCSEIEKDVKVRDFWTLYDHWLAWPWSKSARQIDMIVHVQ